ncbi:proteasome subunit alpha type-7-1B [Drosophila innubila]|uniref:proteasome subunit alpha type-7-1B n=1 Tax=Drosophila innubila TaxID=198719 RepID=UPI00148E1A32|nr:proteasome subunit alpha type-7-1B [Drosophila innubila]
MNRNYDGAVTLFSPDGHLLQVGYAQEAVLRGSTVVGLCTKDCIVLGVEKKAVDILQIERTVRKIRKLDDHIIITFAGLTADARVLIDRAQAEAQSHRLNRERPATVEYITRYIASLKQLYTQSNGLRPYGVSCLVGGFDDDGQPHLFQTEPSGIYYEWQANSTGRLGQTMRGYLEKNASEMIAAPNEEVAIKHVVRALHLTTSLDASFFEVAVLKRKQPMTMVSPETLVSLVNLIKQEIAEEQAKQKLRTAT